MLVAKQSTVIKMYESMTYLHFTGQQLTTKYDAVFQSLDCQTVIHVPLDQPVYSSLLFQYIPYGNN